MSILTAPALFDARTCLIADLTGRSAKDIEEMRRSNQAETMHSRNRSNNFPHHNTSITLV